VTSGGNSFDYFLENQPTAFSASQCGASKIAEPQAMASFVYALIRP